MENPVKTPLHIDIISDVACPWCYVGKRNLEAALAGLENSHEVSIRWHPFQLDPTIPAAGIDRQTYFERKFGSARAVENIFDHLKRVGERAGIEFRPEAMPRAINTLGLHQLLHVAAGEGFQHELQEALFRAFFVEGRDLSREEVLLEIVAPWGWDAEKVQAILRDEALRREVDESIRYAYSLGISGVPFFIINQKVALSGAQPPEVFRQAIAEMLEAGAAEGEDCDLESGEC